MELMYPRSPAEANFQIWGLGLVGQLTNRIIDEAETSLMKAERLFLLRICIGREEEQRSVQEKLRHMLEPQFRRNQFGDQERRKALETLAVTKDAHRGSSFIKALFNGAGKEEILEILPA